MLFVSLFEYFVLYCLSHLWVHGSDSTTAVDEVRKILHSLSLHKGFSLATS